MSKQDEKTDHPDKKENFSYPPSEDIYNNDREEENVDPEDISRSKKPNEELVNNEKTFEEDMSGGDLDVPGAELDDLQEDNGQEDEENNSYSIGGDRHIDLEEDQGK